MKVVLRYFKPSGKWYADGEYETSVPEVDLVHPAGQRGPALYQIWQEVEQLKNAKRLPGLREGHSDFTVLIDVPDHPHRHPCIIFGES